MRGTMQRQMRGVVRKRDRCACLPEPLAQVHQVAVDAVERGDGGEVTPAFEAVAFEEGDAGGVVAEDEGDEGAQAEARSGSFGVVEEGAAETGAAAAVLDINAD